MPKNKIQTVPKNKIQTVQKTTAVVQQIRQGPIPTPEDMASYKIVDPSLPSRIMKMAETEQENQNKYRSDILEKQDSLNRRDFIYDTVALCFCAVLCLVFIISAVILFLNDKTISAGLFSVSAFIVLPKSFLGKRASKKDSK